MRIIIWGLLILMFACSCKINKEKLVKEHTKLASKIDSLTANSKFNGVIYLAKDTSKVYSKTMGYANLESQQKIKINDQFVIGSISKQITAALVLREYEKGNLSLNDTIGKYLKKIEQPWSKKISIHHLLTHTHGIRALDLPLEFEQGTQFKYSQLGYHLLALILEEITHKSFNDLSTLFFEEIGLLNTFHPQNTNYKNLVKGYEEVTPDSLVYATSSLENYAAAGSFISNAKDLCKWNFLLHSGQIVKKETLQLMASKYATRNHPIFEKIEYGYGLIFKDKEENIQIGAFGYTPGFVSTCYYYPQTNLSLIVLENTARNLDNFKVTFEIHTKLMELIKKEQPISK